MKDLDVQDNQGLFVCLYAVSPPIPYTPLFDDTGDGTVVFAHPGGRGRDEILIDSSGVGQCVVGTKAHPEGNYKTAYTLINDDQIVLAYAPFYELACTGVAGRFIVGAAVGQGGQ